MTQYAKGSSVSSERSRAEIERTLMRFGATKFRYMFDGKSGQIAFIYNDRAIALTLHLPDQEKFRYTPSRRNRRSNEDTYRAWEQGCREAWRALALLIKAKLVGIESGISTFEKEFLADTMLPDGTTVHTWLEPQIVRAIASGTMPQLMLTGECHD